MFKNNFFFNPSLTSKIVDVLTEHCELLHVLLLAVHLDFFDGQVGAPLFEFFLWDPSFMLKNLWWLIGWVGVGPHDFSVSPSPLRTNWGFELGWTGLGLGLGGFETKGLGFRARA